MEKIDIAISSERVILLFKYNIFQSGFRGFIKGTMIKFFLVALILLVSSLPALAQIRINTLLTTEGLNKEGFPVTYRDEFSLSKHKGVQYYIEWIPDNQEHNIKIKWFDPKDRLINYLNLSNFSDSVARDYISFINKNKSQLMVPSLFGEYSIYFYLDDELLAISKFKISK
ncbi:hypothetical protein BX659_105183 [Orenia metallireducens]|uniref:Uncharacterized protein n=1 Tax=Orenia metallireducens TaxID=1413210 RepID=A0A285G2H7_9FIRM|nr:hypothetical protein BX659_105183 [Orenia metallireducens]SNY17725.1 hypothetical protein SAMN06265827_104183 [Orenia metallireducens]